MELTSREEESIERFWIWFDDNKSVYNHIDEENRDELMDDLVTRLHKIQGDLSAEISNEIKGVRDLTISAEGDENKFPIVQRIVHAAPKIKGWTVIAFRQPIDFDFTLAYDSIKFETAEMYFSPVVENDTLDLIIYARGISKHDSDLVNNYGLTTMDGVLGEYDCVTKVRYFDFHDLDNEQDKSDLRPLRDLRAFVDSFHKQEKSRLRH
ncbi:MAG: hypothetical protein INR73_12960 [Williamsia sp.]|nr:hypothetical protein [Williamsia sp.]